MVYDMVPSVGVSSEDAVATDPDALRFWKMTLLARMSIASCSSPVTEYQDMKD